MVRAVLCVVLALGLAACDASNKTDDATAAPHNVCDWLTSDWRDGANLSEGTPDGPGHCIYEDSLDGGPKVRISVRSRGGRSEAAMRQGDEAAVRVVGLGAPALWVTTGARASAEPATTTSTAIGTADEVRGRLVVSPPGYLVTVQVSGEFNNSRMAEDIAKQLLPRL
jgi:hypothetical protein